MDIYNEIERLISFGVQKHLIEDSDIIYIRNYLFDLLQVEPKNVSIKINESLDTATSILDKISIYAIEKGFIEDSIVEKDLFECKVMGMLMPRPSEVIKKFNKLYDKEKSHATDYLYDISKSSNYIMVDRVEKNIEWDYKSDYGTYKITINVSKPEKDPKDIAKAKNMKNSDYPTCVLCKENIGFAGNFNRAARQTIRTVPLNLDGEIWNLQYSPYVYYNEHCIVFKDEHTPMTGSNKAYTRLFDFLDILPHYFIGSNAGKPIVGGSILSHDHFQGGNQQLPLVFAKDKIGFKSDKYRDVKISILKWQMSVVRLSSKSRESLVAICKDIQRVWEDFNSEICEIQSHTGDESHNAITPISRINNIGDYEIDIVLRNNLTSEKHPMGIFHPHEDVHHIKKENIGLIEVAGLGVLPKRLVDELEYVKEFLISDNKDIQDAKESIHYNWICDLVERFGQNNSFEKATDIVKNGVGEKFERCLADCGVFKDNETSDNEFKRFLEMVGIVEK
ncbi:MAG: UDP-glucose--hexose-1-phosphate uridylyltransferase [Lachnospirales bacterium]